METVDRYCLGRVVIVPWPCIFRYPLFITRRMKGGVVCTDDGAVYVKALNPTVWEIYLSEDVEVW